MMHPYIHRSNVDDLLTSLLLGANIGCSRSRNSATSRSTQRDKEHFLSSYKPLLLACKLACCNRWQVSASAPRSRNSTNVGAIAGGVVGGVAGLAIAVMLVFFLLHHRRKISTQDQDTDVHHLPDVEASQINGELDESCAKVELPVKEKTHEIGQEWFQELDPERIYELDGPGQYRGRL